MEFDILAENNCFKYQMRKYSQAANCSAFTAYNTLYNINKHERTGDSESKQTFTVK